MRDPLDRTGKSQPPEWEPEPLHIELHLPINERDPSGRREAPEDTGARSTVIVIDLC